MTGADVEAAYADALRRLDRPAEPVLVGQVAAFDLDDLAPATALQLDLFTD